MIYFFLKFNQIHFFWLNFILHSAMKLVTMDSVYLLFDKYLGLENVT